MEDYISGIRSGNRSVIGQAITLVESSTPRHRTAAEALISALLPDAGTSFRVGISGVPGVGKSTFIETFGSRLTAQGLKIAVLAIDPTSRRSGGSILADKTRMEQLASDPMAFIRPSPTAGHLGGVARATRESIIICEAAGYDIVAVETVGTGQSETTVADMVDLFLLLMLPNAGDEFQGIKKGILELADIIAINKVDDDHDPAARQTCQDYRAALDILGHHASTGWKTPVVTTSGRYDRGLDTLWETMQQYRTQQTASGALETKRKHQQCAWMWSLVQGRLDALFRNHPVVRQHISDIEADVKEGTLDPSKAAEQLLAAFFGKASASP